MDDVLFTFAAGFLWAAGLMTALFVICREVLDFLYDGWYSGRMGKGGHDGEA